MNAGFPIELVDSIIDLGLTLGKQNDYWHILVQSRHQWLATCSLICRSWLPRTRFHLFRIVSVDRGQSHERTLELQDLMNSPLSTIIRFVRTLELSDRLEDELDDPRESLLLEVGLFRTLTALESLAVMGGAFDELGIAQFVNFFSSFPKLKTLHLEECYFATLSQFAGVLNSFRFLEHVSVHSLRIMDPGIPLNPEITPPAHLTTLLMGREVCDQNYLLEWLTSANPMPQIHTVQLTATDAAHSQPAAKFLGALKLTLSVLTIDIWGQPLDDETSGPGIFCRAIDLRQCSNLTSICFSNLPLYAEEEIPEDISTILSQITSPRIREVIFDVKLGEPFDLEKLDWKAISRILQKPNFSGLQRLGITGIFPTMCKEKKKQMEKRLPNFAKRGIIDVRYTEEPIGS